jgi:septum formation topological specificity factor MinE
VKRTITTKFGTIVVEPWNPPAKKSKAQAKSVSISTLDRRLQIISKWERLHYITPAKANQLRDRVLEEINR